LTKYNPILNLKSFSFSNLDEKIQKKLDRIHSRGLKLVKGDIYNVNDLYELIKRKNDRSSDFYKIFYKVFKESDMVDLFLVEVDYHSYLENLQDEYATELSINERINKVFKDDTKNKDIYKEKMVSDRKLNDVNKEIGEINLKIQNGVFKEIIAGALVVKFNGVASIFASGFNKSYNSLLPNHFLHYMLITTYKQEGFNFLDLNGMAGDFSKDSPYKGLNEFKMIWNPRVYEYLGEFDFILSYTKYSLLWTTKQLHKEFERSPRVI
ncbi:MAG: peptidoglycan bridge formation glycyltransferase FemA/FemB family protein, partial [Bacilli bacterium]|nr:peptidoglycan bridge formation glycyltransferase FemA/FemB family protein [Bacilli bacterium]